MFPASAREAVVPSGSWSRGHGDGLPPRRSSVQIRSSQLSPVTNTGLDRQLFGKIRGLTEVGDWRPSFSSQHVNSSPNHSIGLCQSVGRMGEDCGFCLAAPGKVPWIRVRPAGDRALACEDCNARLLRAAGDRGATPEDYARMSQCFVGLGGEIWNCREVDFYFRSQQRTEGLRAVSKSPRVLSILTTQGPEPKKRPVPKPWFKRLFSRN